MTTHIDSGSIDLLLAVLSSLKNVGDANSIALDDLWNCPIFDQNTYLTNDSRLLDGMMKMKHLRETRSMLAFFIESLDRKLSSIRYATRPAVFSRGIEYLPEELLAHIFIFAATSWKAAFQISWVSRRFRSTALSTPCLWSKLPYPSMDEMNIELMKCLLERSGNVGLTIEMPMMITENYELNPEWDEAVGMLMEHSHRWKELSVDLAAIHSDGQITFPDAALDAVEQLYLGDHPLRYTWSGYGTDYEAFDDASPEFYRSWSFPNLKKLISDMHIPPAGLFPSLTELSLDLSLHAPLEEETDSDQQAQLIDKLVSFLRSVPTLEIFSFTAGEYSYGQITSGVVTLPSLKTLHLEDRGTSPHSMDLLYTISSSLHIPAVETISLSLDMYSLDEFLRQTGPSWLSKWFPERHEYRNLKRLKFKLESMNDVLTTSVVSNVAQCPFSALEEIEIDSAGLSYSRVVPIAKQRTSLRRVRLRETHGQRGTMVREYTFDDEGMDFNPYTC